MTSEARDIVERLLGPVMDAAVRLTNSAFNNPERRAQFSIPADPERDSDLLVTRGIQEAAEEIRRLREALRGLLDAYVCASPDVGDDIDKARQALSPTGD